MGGNPNSDQAVRKALAPLAAFAEKAELAVLIARHLTKHGSQNPLYRGAGSIGIIAVARAALWITSDPSSDDPYRHLLVQTKTNLSTAASLCYRTVKESKGIVIEWLGESNYAAKDLVGTSPGDPSALQEATGALQMILADGALPAKEVIKLAGEAGVCKRTLDRAKKVLGVKSLKQGSGWSSRWKWMLPEEDHQPQAVSPGVNVAAEGGKAITQ